MRRENKKANSEDEGVGAKENNGKSIRKKQKDLKIIVAYINFYVI